ncbi:MAG: hypothetical protein GX229_12370 [Syntrophomonadaceae bacterium]|jgi:hypothetical protein|nr:hypothetical protein [Syntrophomonadaceae bacterium]
MLSRNKIIFIIAIILVNTALALGLYSNCHMDNMLNEVDTAGVVQAMAYRENNMGQEQEYERLTQAEGSRWNHNWQNFVIWMQDILPFLRENNKSSDEALVAERIMAKIGQPVSKDDLLKGATIIMNKLDEEEIRFIYKVACNEEPTPEEMQEVRRILLSKLSPEDIDTLKALGAKYGKKLRILDP